MGMLKKALEPPSSYSAKQTDVWAKLCAEVDACVLPAQIEAFETWMAEYPLEIPGPYRTPLRERIEARREAIGADDISEIVRTKYDFT